MNLDGVISSTGLAFNEKSSNEVFRVRLAVPNVHMSRVQSCTNEPGGTVLTACPDLGIAIVRSAFQQPLGREEGQSLARVLHVLSSFNH